jgi:ubiquinone/menaquinone biosynthesis C-methylase UbiE
MESEYAAAVPAEALTLVPATEAPEYAKFVKRKRAEFAHLAPQYELQCLVATMGRIKALREQVAGLAVSDVKGPVLELCCGTGGVTAELSRLFDDVTGIDLSPDMLARAARRVQREQMTNVRLREAEVSTVRYPAASFSAVVISLGLHELPLEIRNQVLERAAVWLKPGGRFVFCDYVVPPNRLQAAFFRWVGRLVIEEEFFDEYLAYSIEANLKRHGFRPIERHRQLLSAVEVSAWTIGGR